MADDEVLVSLTARIDQLIAGFNEAAEQAGSSLGQIETSVRATANLLQASLAPAAEHAAESVHKVHEEVSNIGEVFDHIKEKLHEAFEATGIALAYEAMEKLEQVAERIGEHATEIRTFSQVLGLSGAQIQTLQLAAEEAGASFEVVARAVERLNTLMVQARQGNGSAIEKLHELGITNEQIADPLFGTNDLLEVLHSRLEEASTSQKTMNSLVAELGPRAALAAVALKEYDGSTQGVKTAMDDVNGLLDEQTKRLHEIGAWWEKLGTSALNAAGKVVIALADMAKAQPKGGSVSDLMDNGSAEEQAAAVEAAEKANEQQAESAKEKDKEVTESAKKSTDEQEQLINGVSLTELKAVKYATELYEEGTKNRLTAAKTYADLAAKYYGANDVDKVLEANKELLAAQRAYDQELIRMKQEANRHIEEDTRDHEAALKKDLEEINKSMKEIVDQAQQQAKGILEAQLGAIQMQQDAIAEAYKSGKLSPAQEYKQEVSLIQQKLAAQLNYYEELKRLAGTNAAEIEKYNQEEVKANVAAGNAIVLAQNKFAEQVRQTWEKNSRQIENAFTSNIVKMIEGTQSFHQAVVSICSSILDTFIRMIVDMVAKWLVGMITNLVVGKTTAASQISANAGVAATAAMASVAAIPFVGWAMAPEVGASTYALAEGYEASVASAAGGWEVPSDQLAMVHKNEMILPERLSTGIKDMISANTASQGRGGTRSGDTYHISALDAQSLKQALGNQRNRTELGKAIRKVYTKNGGVR